MDPILQLELTIIHWLQNLGTGFIVVMKGFTFLGQEEFFMLVVPSLYWCFNAALGFRVGLVLVFSNALNFVFKLLFVSPRPYFIDPTIQVHASETSFGLPSGHSQTAASVWGFLASKVKSRWIAGIFIIVFIIVGLSRLFLGVHFIHDVLVGWLIGGLFVLGFLKFEKPLTKYFLDQRFATLVWIILGTTIVLLTMQLLVFFLKSSWQIPPEWITNAKSTGAPVPDPLNPEGIFTLTGTFLGLTIGYSWLIKRFGSFDAGGKLWMRLIRFVIGVIGVMLFWFGLGLIFPKTSDIIGYSLRAFRYFLVGLWISLGAPWIFVRLKLSSWMNSQRN